MPAKLVQSLGGPTERVRDQFARALCDALPGDNIHPVPVDVGAGAVEFLTKPFGDDVLRNAIGKLLSAAVLYLLTTPT